QGAGGPAAGRLGRADPAGRDRRRHQRLHHRAGRGGRRGLLRRRLGRLRRPRPGRRGAEPAGEGGGRLTAPAPAPMTGRDGPDAAPAGRRLTEGEAMREAVAMSWAAAGRTSPNPAVGAVVLDAGGRVCGVGVTSPPGGPHAEAAALRQAGEGARGGTAVVTLEPCDHTGRTGPCSRALIDAGIARVVYAVPDRTPPAAGGGATLQAAGVSVGAGLGADEAQAGPLRPWLHRQ